MRIMVLTDGETFSTLDGCAIFEIDDELDTEQIEEMLEGEDDDGLTLVKRFGPHLPCDGPDIEPLADEFTENGLEDVADRLRSHGLKGTLDWIGGVIDDARENDDPEGWRLGNLEVAKQKLQDAAGPIFGELELQEFTYIDGEDPGDGSQRLDRFAHGTLVEDKAGNLFNVVGYGPVQGSVEIVDDNEVHAYYDGDTKLRCHAHAPDPQSKNRTTAETVEYQCSACGLHYGVAE